MSGFVATPLRRRPPVAHGVADGCLWGGAAVVVLLAHLGIGYTAFSRTPSVPHGAPETAIMIELAPEISAPETSETEAEPGPPQVAAPEAEIRPEPVDEPEPEPAPAEPPPPEPEPDVTEPVEEDVPEEVVETPEEVVQQAAVPLPAMRPPVPRRIEQPAKERPEPVKRERPVRRAATRPPAPVTSAPPAAARRDIAAAPQVAGASSVSPATWQSRLMSHLNRHKRYPNEARRRGEQGTVRVALVIDPSGRIVEHRIVGGSGNPSLDAAVADMARRASPVPAPPPSIAKARLTLTVPISFRLR